MRYCQVRLGLWICLQSSTSTPFNRLFRQPAGVSLPRPHFSPKISTGILTGSSIGVAVRRSLRARLTLIRLTLIRNPWSFGVRVSFPHYRYSYLHLLFQTLQFSSPKTFAAFGMLPYQLYKSTIPRLRQDIYARLLSTPGHSTSELLRTL